VSGLILSLFPGIGMLDHAFELEGFTVVRGPDLLWGGDIHRFHPPAGVFDGVIGGPPCQAFSRLRHIVEANGYQSSPNLIPEFERVVLEASPRWFVMENVPKAPEPAVQGFGRFSELVSNRDLGELQDRTRRITLGVKGCGELLVIPKTDQPRCYEPAVVADSRPVSIKVGGSGKVKASHTTRKRSIGDCCELQGLPRDYMDGTPFTASAARKAIANGVPIPMGRAIARAVRKATQD